MECGGRNEAGVGEKLKKYTNNISSMLLMQNQFTGKLISFVKGNLTFESELGS